MSTHGIAVDFAEAVGYDDVDCYDYFDDGDGYDYDDGGNYLPRWSFGI